MDSDTRDFITQQNDKLAEAIDKLRDNMDKKLTGLQTTLAAQNLKLGQGSERFRAIDTRFIEWGKDNTSWHRTLITLIILAFSGLASLAFKLL